MQIPSRHRWPAALLIIVISTLGFATSQTPVNAQATATNSPIAVPFIGDYEVWCTDRNPAPGNRCRSHHGSPAIDIGMDPGTPLFAAGDGTVIEADDFCPARGSCNNGKGNSVIISHADGTYSRYLHMNSVSVAEDQVLAVGDPIGTAGESGQWSSPHLHYDEHFPFGTRTYMGLWIGCVGGEQVRYPEVFGTSDWNEVPYGSRVVNEGFDCLASANVEIPTSEPPRVLAGTTHFGITAPTDITRTQWQISIDSNDGSTPEVVAVSGTTLIYRSAPANTVSVRARQAIDGVLMAWSEPGDYTPPATPDARPVCAGLHATTTSMTGTPDVDVIVGTEGTDAINARGGDDIICAGSGDDDIIAGIGKDRVFGGAGNDTISGGKGFDLLKGEAGDDSIRGGNGKDKIYGGPGNDSLSGNAGSDFVDGGKGDDLISGGIGHDSLRGSADNDSLEGRNGRDVLLGGNGDDALDGGNGQDRIVGGAGADTLTGADGKDRCVDADNDSRLIGCEV